MKKNRITLKLGWFLPTFMVTIIIVPLLLLGLISYKDAVLPTTFLGLYETTIEKSILSFY
ncbi:hypothetical protein OXB_0666 [Bacillus sp. OxB-1]|nr:hypothetical protein OXB_0666 [Bacillus sp. OxB-1]